MMAGRKDESRELKMCAGSRSYFSTRNDFFDSFPTVAKIYRGVSQQNKKKKKKKKTATADNVRYYLCSEMLCILNCRDPNTPGSGMNKDGLIDSAQLRSDGERSHETYLSWLQIRPIFQSINDGRKSNRNRRGRLHACA